MNEQITEALIAIAIPVITAALSALALTMRQYLNTKIAAIQHEQLRLRVADLVNAAEQQFAGIGSDERKLDYVTEQAWVFVQQLGLSLTREQVRALIEAAVRAMTVQEATITTVTVPAATSTTTTEATVTSTTAAAQLGGAVG